MPGSRYTIFVCLYLALCAGCDSSEGRSSVQGKVSYEDESVDQGGIAFIPDEAGPGEPRFRATGEIKDGQYAFVGRRGLLPGKYQVKIYWPKKTGNKVPGEGDHLKDETEEVIPTKYNDETELTVDVAPGRNKFDFALKK